MVMRVHVWQCGIGVSSWQADEEEEEMLAADSETDAAADDA